MKLRILADDLTGALDSAAAFAGENPVWLDRPGDGDAADVAVVATATRDVPAAELPTLLEPSRAWLHGADIAFKKVDSLLRGNSLEECAVLARGFTRVAFAPAFPAQGRVTVAGRAWLVRPAGEPRAIGDGSIAERFAALGIADAWVPDACSDDELQRIAARSREAAAQGWLWCGSAGLAQAMATVHGLAPTAGPIGPPCRPALLVSASHHPVLRRQWARLPAHGGIEAIDLSLPDAASAAAAAAQLAAGLERLVAHTPPPAAIAVIGGDTLRALCRATGTQALRAGPAARAGWGRARLVGGHWNGTVCHTRSGAFGGDDDLIDALRTLA